MFGSSRTVAVRYTAEVNGYVAGMRRMQSSTSDFASRAASSAKANSAAWDDISTKAIGAGLAIGAGVAVAVKKAADFEQAMSRVGAVSGASAREMTALSEAALKAGEDTVFSATEAAAAQEELAKAGVSTADILGGALRGSLDLAAAGGLDLAKSAEIAAQAMNLFSLEGSDVSHIADVLTAAANKSAAGVEDLGMALSQGGTVAAATGLTLEETAATLAMFADYGLKGSDAGTSLKTMLQRLNPTSKEASDAMDALGIAAYDANGEFVGMEALGAQLQTRLAGLTDEQRNAALATIFGSDAVRGANIIMMEGAEGAREYAAAVNDIGAAQRMAERMTDNLKGDWEELTGAIETALIKTGSGGTEAIRGWVQALEGAVSWYNQLSQSTQSAVLNVAAFTAAVLLVGGATMKATTSVLAFKASLEAVGLTAGKTGTALRALGTGAAVAGLAYVASGLKESAAAAAMTKVSVDDLAGSLSQLTRQGQLSGGIADLFRDTFMWDEKIVTTTEALDRFAIRAEDAFGDSMMQKLARFSGNNAMTRFTEETKQLDAALAQMVQGGKLEEAQAIFEALMSNVDPSVVEETKAAFTEYSAAVDTAAVAAGGTTPVVKGLNDAMDQNADGMINAAEAAEAAAKALKGAQDALTMLGGGFRAEQAALRSVQESLTGIREAAKDGGGWNELSAAMEKAADDALTYAGAQAEMGRGSEAVAAGIQRVRDQVIESGVSAGKSRTYMEDYADAIGLIPEEARTIVEAAGVVQSTAEVMAMDESIRRLDDKTVTVKEEGANPSKGRVMELDGAIFGLDGKTVKVEEIGSTASGDRVVRFRGEIYKLTGKTVKVEQTGAERSTAEVARLQAARDRLQDKLIRVGVQTSGEQALRNLQSLINGMSGRNINVNTYMTTYRKNVDMGTYKSRADGGLDVYAYAGGGFFDKSLRDHQPGVYPVTKRGILMAEEGAGPWEAYISGHPAKAARSRDIWLETGRRLGMVQAYADGTLRNFAPQYVAPPPRVTVNAPTSALSLDGARFDLVVEDGTVLRAYVRSQASAAARADAAASRSRLPVGGAL